MLLYSKLIDENNKNIQLNKNDLIIFSSREIPGNEKKINLLKRKILKKKCQYFDHRMMKVHVSGHPSKNELKKCMNGFLLIQLFLSMVNIDI